MPAGLKQGNLSQSSRWLALNHFLKWWSKYYYAFWRCQKLIREEACFQGCLYTAFPGLLCRDNCSLDLRSLWAQDYPAEMFNVNPTEFINSLPRWVCTGTVFFPGAHESTWNLRKIGQGLPQDYKFLKGNLRDQFYHTLSDKETKDQLW